MRKTGLTVAVVALLFLLAAAPARAATTWGISDGQVVPSLTVPGHDGGYSYNTIYLGKGGGTISGSIADGSGTDFYLVIKDNPGQNGASILRLTGNNQGYSGTIDLDAGILSIGNADALVQNLSNLHFNGVQSQALTDARIATTEALRNNWTAYTSGAAETALTGLMTAIDAQRQLGSVDMDDYNPDVYGVGTLVIEAGVHVVRDGFGSTSQQIDMNRYFLMSGQGWKKGTAAFHLEDGATPTIQNSRAQVNSGGILNVITDNIVTMTADGDGRYFFKDSADIAVNNEGTLVLQKATLSGNTAGAFANKATAFLSDMEFSNNTGTAVSNESHLVMTDYSISGNDTGIYNSGKLLLQTSAGETSTIKENTTGVLIAGSVANKGVIIVDGAGTTDMQDGLQPITYDDPVASIDKYGTGTWKLGNSFTVTGASEIDFTVHDGTLHLYRQGEVTGVNAGAIDFSGAGNSSFSVTDAAVLSIGGGNTIKGNENIAAKMMYFYRTGGTSTDGRLTREIAVDFSPEAVNITNTSGLTTSDYLLVQAEAGGLSGFTTKLYQDGVEYVPARSSKAGDTMIGLKTSVDNSQLSLGTADATQNTTVYWNPGATNLWDVATTANWEGTVNGMNISTFLNNDSVFFSQFFEGPVMVAPSGVTVTTMNMQGSYTFTGGDITGTGSLIVSGGSNVTFANRLNMNEINLTSYIETITFAPAADWTLNSVIIGGGNVVMDAAEKTLTLAAANTYTGTTHVKSGTLAVADAAGIASSTQVTVDENATLAFTAAGASTIKDIRGAGILEKRGTGDLSVESGQFSGFIDMKQTGAVFRKTSTGIFEFSGNGSGGSFSLDAGAVIFDDAFWYGDFTAANGTRLDVATESTLRGSATFTGATLGLSDTLNVIVSARLDNATLDLDLATGGKLSSDGAVTLTNANTLNITNWVNGEHLVIESGSGITTGGTLGVTVNGQAITSSRLDAVVEMRDSDKQMYLTTTSTNYAFIWTGATNNTWDYGSANWFSPDTSDTAIIAGDKVIFEQATEGTIDIASGGVQVSEVSVTGDYTYTGGGINVAANSVGDGTFRIENGASVTFDNAANSFENGISVETGGTLAFTRANQLGSGTLSFESGATTFVSESFTDIHVANAITLAGTTAVEANGHLFLTGTVSGAGGLSILDNSVVQLVGVNTYAGGTLVENATLLAGNAKALGTGLITAVDSAVYYAFINTDSAADYADLVGKTTLTRSDLFLLGDSSESFGDSLALAAADAGSQVKLDGAFTLNGNAGIDAKSASLIL
ncbi:MAG: autotransporter-associated beta strand repeat-containing protein, partial [Planctomycetaceae bacterium]|nr:autotransporter-associated beta strand repeat-containing protein [Planctomycetaceae bacterium]